MKPTGLLCEVQECGALSWDYENLKKIGMDSTAEAEKKGEGVQAPTAVGVPAAA